MLAFCLFALLLLALFRGKYGQRQATLERRYQARERVMEGEPVADLPAEDLFSLEEMKRRRFVSPDDTLVPLWPLTVILIAGASFAIIMLYRRYGQFNRLSTNSTSS
jgi:hypothetical protein